MYGFRPKWLAGGRPLSGATATVANTMSDSRNAPCQCGSGRKYKRCCLAARDRQARAARYDDAVGRRIQEWSSDAFPDELDAALDVFLGPDRSMSDADLQLFATWFHNDRELAGGGTPAQRYASRADLPTAERATAARIAGARLGIHRVLASEPGGSLELEDILGGGRIRVRSANVSRTAVRWDIVLCRVMDGDPPSVWGPVRIFDPCDEPELLEELERRARAASGRCDVPALSSGLRENALELTRFIPPGARVARTFFTLEGDPVAMGSATWRVQDVPAVSARLRRLGGLDADEPIEVDITFARAALVEGRPALPRGAIVIESGPVGQLDTVPVASLRLERTRLHAEAMSEERLDRAIELVERDFGDVVELVDREVRAVEDALADRRETRHSVADERIDIAPEEERRILRVAMTERMRLWLDEPHPELDGQTPRTAAAAGGRRADVVRLVRGIENGAERARRRNEPSADVAWLRRELGLDDELAA